MLERSTTVIALIVSTSGRILAANTLLSNVLRMGTAGDLVGRSVTDLLVEPADWKAWGAVQRDGWGAGMTVRLRRSDGEAITLKGDVTAPRDGAHKGRLVGLFADVTEERQLRRAMQRGARLEALGSLTSGVAHDFNNLLTVLVGNLSLVAEELRGRPELFGKLKAARDAAKRGADLIRQLLAFARNQTIQAEVLKPAQVVSNLVPLLGRALGAKVRLETELDAGTGAVRGTVAQLESVIVNLAVNARDAFDSGGRVVIAVRDVNLSTSDARRYDLPGGAYVRISVEDDGAGIAAENLGRVFEPFFSTKGDRGGTGLGLSMVRAYATQFSGTAYIESALKKGTTVSLLFPRCGEATDETSAKTMPLSTLPTGKESILLVATEESLKATVGQILEVLGYSVRVSTDPREAAGSMRTQRVDLVILDGMYASAAAQLADGGCPIVQLTSGAEGQVSGKVTRVLAKPFALADLAQTVRAAIDSPAR